jgi:hypothetical protein
MLGQGFGVCTNEIAPSDGRVVSLDFGCGAHSEAAVVPATHPTSEPVVDEYVYDTVTFERVVQPENAASQAAEAAAAAVVEAVPAGEVAGVAPEATAQAEADGEGITAAADGVEEPAVEEPVDES